MNISDPGASTFHHLESLGFVEIRVDADTARHLFHARRMIWLLIWMLRL